MVFDPVSTRQAEFTQTVIEAMIDGVAVCHAIEAPPHTAFTIWNRAMEDLTGFTMAEINRLGWSRPSTAIPQCRNARASAWNACVAARI